MTARNALGTAVMICLMMGAVTGWGGVVAGRSTPKTRDANIRLGGGVIMEIAGTVQETTRRFYDATDQQFKQSDAERFDLDDFDFDDGFGTVGLSLEKAAKYFTFQMELGVMQPDVSTVARRNYYIGVDGVDFNGQTYEHMQIPEGQAFEMEITALMADLRFLLTPCTVEGGERFAFTPWAGIGLFLWGGEYDLDAGPARGVIQYQEPPEDFVVGGQSSGYLGIGVPELALGGEMRFGRADGVNLVLQGTYAVLEYDGDTGWITSSKHREKDLDLEHVNIRARAQIEIPRGEKAMWTVGVQYQLVDSEALISTKEDLTLEEVIARRERFDKEVDFHMKAVMGTVGLTF
jgi:hypothetical protein